MEVMSHPGGPSSAHPGAAPSGLSGGRIALLAASVAYAIVVVWQAFTLPDTVPGHMDAAGNITRWTSRTAHVLMATGVGVLVVAVFLLPAALIKRLPTSMLNLPHKEYWTRPENWPAAQQRLGDDLGWMGAATLAFMAFIMAQVAGATGGEAQPVWVFWVVTAVYLVGVLAYSAWMSLGSGWRPPADAESRVSR